MLQGMSTPSLKPLRKPSAPAMELKERGDETLSLIHISEPTRPY